MMSWTHKLDHGQRLWLLYKYWDLQFDILYWVNKAMVEQGNKQQKELWKPFFYRRDTCDWAVVITNKGRQLSRVICCLSHATLSFHGLAGPQHWHHYPPLQHFSLWIALQNVCSGFGWSWLIIWWLRARCGLVAVLYAQYEYYHHCSSMLYIMQVSSRKLIPLTWFSGSNLLLKLKQFLNKIQCCCKGLCCKLAITNRFAGFNSSWTTHISSIMCQSLGMQSIQTTNLSTIMHVCFEANTANCIPADVLVSLELHHQPVRLRKLRIKNQTNKCKR